jgi:uncharacterized delta-60 repeat protein
VLTSISASNAGVHELAPSARGLIVGAHVVTDGPVWPYVLRYTPDGRLDRSYGEAGIVTRVRGLGDDWYLAGALPDGRALLGGATLTRLRRDGRLDETFGTGGRTRFAVGRCRYRVGSAQRQRDGKLVVDLASCREEPDDATWELGRTLPNGRLDRSFGSGGIARIRVGVRGGAAYISSAEEVVLLSGGALIAAGDTTPEPGKRALAVVRLTAAGRVDTAFGADGFVVHPAEGDVIFGDLAARSNGGVLVAGCDDRGGSPEDSMFVAAYNADGSLDRSWGTDGVGRYEARVGMHDVSCAALAERTDGKVFLLGNDLALLDRNGAFDASFGDQGVVQARTADALLLQPRNRVLVAGGVDLPEQKRGIAIFRYLP